MKQNENSITYTRVTHMFRKDTNQSLGRFHDRVTETKIWYKMNSD